MLTTEQLFGGKKMINRLFLFLLLFFTFSCSTSQKPVFFSDAKFGSKVESGSPVLKGIDYLTVYNSAYLKYVPSKQMFLGREDEEVLEIDERDTFLKWEGDDLVYISKIPELKSISGRFFVVYFDFNSAILKDNQAVSLRKFVDSVLGREKDFKKVRILLGGYTDEVGSFDYNFKLGYMRAMSVKEFLEDFLEGVDVDFVVYSGGKCCFISRDSAKNRRVEVEVYAY